MSNQPDYSNLSDEEFKKKLAEKFYKTTYKNIGDLKPNSTLLILITLFTLTVTAQNTHGNNGRFTDHLISSGMYRNASLNTTCERERWIEGSKDWMEHLN